MKTIEIVQIDNEKCIGCGACVKSCLRKRIELTGSKATIIEDISCIECGHCIAVCPQDAVRLSKFDDQIVNYNNEKFYIDPEILMNAIKFRRSIRHFKDKKIKQTIFNNILEAARYSPTGANRQALKYIIVSDKLKELTELAIKTLYQGALDKDNENVPKRYRQKFLEIYGNYQKSDNDMLFFGAPSIILVVGCKMNEEGAFTELDGGLATARIEFMAGAHGLGTCHIGFLSYALKINPDIGRELGINKNEKLISTIALGYPDVKYYRTINSRRKVNVNII